MLKYQRLFSILIISLILDSCTKKQSAEIKPDTTSGPGKPDIEVVYAGAVQSLFQSKCSGCHSQSGPGASSWVFAGYTSVTANAGRIKQAVLVNKTMPIGSSLSAAELKLLQNWFDQGTKP